ncbi:hypothetical protein GOODEAATRI_022386 [Goodea atripinnis]|uniref:Uncharacterized protein n=1 Tax=Goodea atripinnis TaxID=208336 RepID=A0ABV0PQU3_9TELE
MSESARNLVAAILNDEHAINTLASACTNQSSTSNRIQYRTTDEEIFSLFQRGRQSATNAPGPFASMDRLPSQEPPSTAPIYNLRPFTRKGPRPKRFQAPLNCVRPVAQSFTKEVILLPDHTSAHVPRRAKKVWLFQNGLVKSALEFQNDWDSNRVMQEITAAFHPVVAGCR